MFTTFGPGNSYDATGAALNWQGSLIGAGTIDVAAAFTPSRDFELTQIDLAYRS
jgi:hypothetical protein